MSNNSPAEQAHSVPYRGRENEPNERVARDGAPVSHQTGDTSVDSAAAPSHATPSTSKPRPEDQDEYSRSIYDPTRDSGVGLGSRGEVQDHQFEHGEMVTTAQKIAIGDERDLQRPENVPLDPSPKGVGPLSVPVFFALIALVAFIVIYLVIAVL
jgi:hypothetical protein